MKKYSTRAKSKPIDENFVPKLTTFERACDAFDAITEAAYRGTAFRGVLNRDAKALEAAEALAAALRRDMSLLTPAPPGTPRDVA